MVVTINYLDLDLVIHCIPPVRLDTIYCKNGPTEPNLTFVLVILCESVKLLDLACF